MLEPFQAALGDWLACAAAGAGERAAVAAREAAAEAAAPGFPVGLGLLDSVIFAGTAGHVLDFDDTFEPGLAHVSAPTAPAALVVAASLGRSLRDALIAFAAGWEAMASLAEASHPALYDGGWHPTVVCGPAGAAVATAGLLGVSPQAAESALGLAMLRAGGTRGSFGTDGKAIGVGLAAAAGVQAVLLARAGARVDPQRTVYGPLGFTGVMGTRWPAPGGISADEPDAPPDQPDAPPDQPDAPPDPFPHAIERNWIKLHPSCLGTHAPIDAALAFAASDPSAATRLADGAGLEVVVNPVARQAAHIDEVSEPLEGKFSIPYCVAHTLLQAAPGLAAFDRLSPQAVAAAAHVRVVTDTSLPPFGAVLRDTDGRELARVPCPRGAPERPVAADELTDKIRELAGERLLEALSDLDAPASVALYAALPQLIRT